MRRSEQWLYWGLGLTGFLAMVSFRPKPLPPPIQPELKSVDYQTQANGTILVQTIPDGVWTTPKLNSDVNDRFTGMVNQWKELVVEASLDYNVPESWIWATMWAESRGDPRAHSPAGAIGLMQVMPFHFKEGEEPFDPRTNIRAGVRFLQTIRGKVGHDLVRSASMYNAGGPWTNETWLAAHRKPQLTTKWGYPAEHGYIDTVVAAQNTYLALAASTLFA
jgi:hypothetical protein